MGDEDWKLSTYSKADHNLWRNRSAQGESPKRLGKRLQKEIQLLIILFNLAELLLYKVDDKVRYSAFTGHEIVQDRRTKSFSLVDSQVNWSDHAAGKHDFVKVEEVNTSCIVGFIPAASKHAGGHTSAGGSISADRVYVPAVCMVFAVGGLFLLAEYIHAAGVVYAVNTSIHAAGLVCAGSIMFLLADLFLLVVTCFCCVQLDIAGWLVSATSHLVSADSIQSCWWNNVSAA
ncbi:hypothetical protein Tco_0151441 [Tanacetum coccineum]